MNATLQPASMPRTASLLAIALMVALAFSGCTGKSGKDALPTTTSSSSTSSGILPLPDPCADANASGCKPPAPGAARFALNDCWELLASFDTLLATAQAQLPSGYTAKDQFGGTARIVISTLDCASAVLDNQTVLARTQVVFLVVAVEAPQAEAGGLDLYALEVLASNETLAIRMGEEGFPARVASVKTSLDGPTFATEISADGAALYSLSLVGESPEASTPAIREFRFHHQVTGVNNWLNYTQNEGIASSPLYGTLAYHGGMVEKLASTPERVHLTSTLY